jgi:uncharacterized membrane protein
MRAALRIVRAEDVGVAGIPWWRARWLVITGAVLWWLLTYLFWLAVAVVIVALFIVGGLLKAGGIMAHFAGESR